MSLREPQYSKLYVSRLAKKTGAGGEPTVINVPTREYFVGYVGHGEGPEVKDGFLHFFSLEGDDQAPLPRAINLNCVACWRVSND